MAWVIDTTNNGFPYPGEAAALAEKPISPEYPLMLWRITAGVNDGYPYFLLQPPEAPPSVVPVKQRPYICIYEAGTDKLSFNGNGLAILTPTACPGIEALNGQMTITLTHPIDSEGRWRHLREWNLIKADGQIYTITGVQIGWQGASRGTVTVTAEHISYQLADPYIFPIAERFGSTDAQAIINLARSRLYYHAETGQTSYAFQITSDMTFDTPYYLPQNQGFTLPELLIGSGSIAEAKGGELHRDNFNISLNSRKEGAKDNAFDIRLGANLAAATCTIDITTFCSYFRAYDNFGGWWACAWVPTDFMLQNFPHHIVRSANFSYDEPDMDRLAQDGMTEFRRNGWPVICYELTIADMQRSPEFAELSGLPEYKVGNTGRIYDERLGGAVTLKITEVEDDKITGDVRRVVFGERRSFTRSATAPVILDVQPLPVASAIWLHDKNGRGMRDKDGLKLMRKAVL